MPKGLPVQARYVRYHDGVETIEPDEHETFEGIVRVMAGGGKTARERYGRSVRTSHAKAHGLLKGELRVEDGLAAELRQGLYAVPRTYPVIVRLSHVPGELLDDRRVSTPRGLALKILDVDGPMLPAHAGERTQDFVLDTGKVFTAPGAKTFLVQITATEMAAPMPEGVKAAVSTVSRAANKALHAVGLDSANLDFYGHPFRHPLVEAYFSQCPLRYGEYLAKLAVYPDNPALLALVGKDLDLEDENGLRTVVTEFFRTNPAEFEVGIQLCTDLKTMPVEDASTEWPEDEEPLPSRGAAGRAAAGRLHAGPRQLRRRGSVLLPRPQPRRAPAARVHHARPHACLRGAGQGASRGERPPRSGAAEHRGDAGLKNRAEECEAVGGPAPSPDALPSQALRRS